MSTRFHRTTREAFAHERFPAIEVHRAGWLARWGHVAATVSTLGLLAVIGLMLAWRG
jgi:hypothetical protein